jgi:predicted amidohydrolase YtcJ
VSSDVDLIIGNGIVHTVDPRQPRAQAVAISRGAIIAVGTDAEIRDLAGAGTESIDLAGRLLLPGFQDAHVHPSGGGMERRQCDLSAAHDIEDYLRLIASYAEAHPDEEWVTGGGWAMDLFPGGVPSKADLDRIVPDRPVYLSNRDHHGAWVNTLALERAGITRTTPDPVGGRIDRDPHGDPIGALQEGAMDLVSQLMPPASRDEIAASILEGQRYLHSYGITAWQEAIVGDYAVMPDCFDAYVDLDCAGQLTGRVVGALWWDRAAGMRQFEHLLGRRERAATGSRFRATSVKFMQDGVCENFTAAMLTPYLDVHGHETHNHGTSFVDAEELKEFVIAVDKEGFQAHFHAIGDRAVREVLDAVEAARDANGVSDNRHCAAHIQVVHPSDVPRFGALGVLANAQPLWACNEPQMVMLTTPFLGEERAATQYPFASLARTGARLCFGSDWPVSTPDPLAEMHVAVNRTAPPGHHYGGSTAETEPLLPAERLSIDAAIEAFTMGSAYLNHLDAETGSVAIGKRADLVILDQDVTALPATDIGRVAVDMTLVDGRPVYERGAG